MTELNRVEIDSVYTIFRGLILDHLWSLLWLCSRKDFKKRELGLWNISHFPFGKQADAGVTWTLNVASTRGTATCTSSWEICNIYFWELNLLDYCKLSTYTGPSGTNSRKQLPSLLCTCAPSTNLIGLSVLSKSSVIAVYFSSSLPPCGQCSGCFFKIIISQLFKNRACPFI